MLTAALRRVRWRRLFALATRHVLTRSALLGLGVLLLVAPSAFAQGNFVVVRGGAIALNADGTKPTPGFSLPTQTTEIKDAIDEYQRMVKHEQWEKAFKALEGIAAKTTTGYIERNDGVLVPSKMLVRGLLSELPSAGKNAYRLFYDSQAATLWDNVAGKDVTDNKNEADALSTIVANHVISSVGDRAADRLGDYYFEQGDMEQAAGAWRSLLTYCPDSKIPKAQTLVKIAMAVARIGRANELREIERTVRDKYASESVDIGGRKVLAGEQLAMLVSSLGTPSTPVEQAAPDDFDFPESNEPLWQFRFQGKSDPLNPNQPFSIVDIYGRTRANDFSIPTALDDKRVYVNLFGIEMAFDLHSGKLLWRSGKLHQLQMGQNRQGVMPERYSITVSEGRTWSVGREPNQNNQGTGFAMIVREADTGKELFNTKKTLSNWNILGAPYPVGDLVYLGASKNNQGRELSLLVLSAKDGKLIKTVTLGNHAVDQNQVYQERIAQPTFLMHRDRLYIDTHAGALVSMQPQTGNLDWGVMYESPSPQGGYYYYDYMPTSMDHSGPLLTHGILFSKGMRSPRLLGLDVDGPAMVWNRPVANNAVIVGADSDQLYMAGEELTAYSLKTRELLWATQLPRTAAWSKPLLTKNRIYQFTARGVCEVDKATGDVVKIFRGVDLDSYGGKMFRTPEALITVSNLAITAYPLNKTTATPTN